jgi:glutathione S-transferase
MTDYRPILYHRTLSLESLRLRRVIAELRIDVELRDVLLSRRYRDEHEELGGTSLPCLVLAGTVIEEIDEIVKYLRLRYGG